ncbi:MAG: response regulator transcription factor [Chloroflexi bacterium]|nr:response regulator transcription factor [Chloroflexota bacterium]
MTRILVVDDDADIVRLISDYLLDSSYEVITATNGRQALRAAFEYRPDLVLLDIGMPGMDGWDVCKTLREYYDGVIVMLTARDSETDKVKGLDLGADDYMVKPFSRDELRARIRARLRSAARTPLNSMDYQDAALIIDLQRRIVLRNGARLTLSTSEFDLLTCLVRHRGEVVTRDRLLLDAWGADYAGQYDYLRVYVHRLRERLEDDPAHPHYVLTHRYAGYSFGPPVNG